MTRPAVPVRAGGVCGVGLGGRGLFVCPFELILSCLLFNFIRQSWPLRGLFG